MKIGLEIIQKKLEDLQFANAVARTQVLCWVVGHFE